MVPEICSWGSAPVDLLAIVNAVNVPRFGGGSGASATWIGSGEPISGWIIFQHFQ
jgi:hypothetical protein